MNGDKDDIVELKPLGEWAKELGVLLPQEQQVGGVFSKTAALSYIEGYLKYTEQKGHYKWRNIHEKR